MIVQNDGFMSLINLIKQHMLSIKAYLIEPHPLEVAVEG